VQLVTQRGDRIVHLDATAPENLWDQVDPIWQRALETARWEES